MSFEDEAPAVPARRCSRKQTPAPPPQVPLPEHVLAMEHAGTAPPAPKVKAAAPPKDDAIQFQPVTAEGMRAFFQAMQRPSTQTLSCPPSPECDDSQATTVPEPTLQASQTAPAPEADKPKKAEAASEVHPKPVATPARSEAARPEPAIEVMEVTPPVSLHAVPNKNLEIEQRIRDRLDKMDGREITAKIANVKLHPLFGPYSEWRFKEIFGDCHGEINYDAEVDADFGNPMGEPYEDLVSWEFWLVKNPDAKAHGQQAVVAAVPEAPLARDGSITSASAGATLAAAEAVPAATAGTDMAMQGEAKALAPMQVQHQQPIPAATTKPTEVAPGAPPKQVMAADATPNGGQQAMQVEEAHVTPPKMPAIPLIPPVAASQVAPLEMPSVNPQQVAAQVQVALPAMPPPVIPEQVAVPVAAVAPPPTPPRVVAVAPHEMPPPSLIPQKVIAPVAVSHAPPVDPAEERKQNRAQWMRFSRNVRGPNCPKPIQAKYEAAMHAENSQQEIRKLFEEFKACQEDWLVSSLMLEESRSQGTSREGVWVWCTRQERMHFCLDVQASDQEMEAKWPAHLVEAKIAEKAWLLFF